MKTTASILVEIDESLHNATRDFLESHPTWDQDRVYAAALSLFLLQNGECDRRASRVYLDSLFKQEAA